MTKADLPSWVEAALISLGGEARIVDVAREIWRTHETELRESGDLFYTWQYDMRWAAYELRRNGRLQPEARSSRMWKLA